MSNFSFLSFKREYALFAAAAIEAERVYNSSPAMSAIGSRKALELAVKWVYSADSSISMPFRDNLQSLIHEPSFRFSVDSNTWAKLPYIIRLGNLAVHTERNINASDALMSLQGLFEFIEWIDYCYGTDYVERQFDESIIPKERVVVDTTKIKEQESLLGEKDAEIERLRKKIEKMAAEYTAAKEENKAERTFEAEDISEFKTRKKYIDIDLKELGWKFTGEDSDVWEEYEVDDMMGIPGQFGYVDYVLFGKDGLPLAVIEAKRTSKDPNIGRKQALLYAECLERKFGRRPVMFTTNGFETYYWDDLTSPQRRVSELFSKNDLQKLINRREEKKSLKEIPIDDKITDRYYQKEAIRAVCDHIESGFRKNLLVMATGTGKTRTASSLTDLLSRGNVVTNVLFLADRTALVKQAKDDFKNYLPHMSLCNLCSNKDERNARIVFSTYPTMLNAIDDCKTEDGTRLFTPAHFDLIIVDESHRSIFKKYKAIFDYFDAILVGLTATPKTDVDRNTYDFFEMENGIPTYAYDYETAVYEDQVLVPYYNYEVKTKFLDEGITYDDLSDEDKERYEEDFAEDDYVPDFIPSEKLNKFVFNELTVDVVLQDLMERGIKVAGGDLLGKSIIFAQNKRHAEFILERFNKLYPQYKGKFAQRVICDDAYAQTIIDDFKVPDKDPRIAVSVDMMDTGIDVPECVNLVFFKKVRSKTKFWQMIGRGTRLAPDLECLDQIDGSYIGKRRFLIFDYCGNFELFRTKPNGFEGKETKTLSENIFGKKIVIVSKLQTEPFANETYQEWRKELVSECHGQVGELKTDIISVRLKREFVEKYKKLESFSFLSEGDKGELLENIAPLVYFDDEDEYAKRFDNFMYGLIISFVEGKPSFKQAKKQLCEIGTALEKKISVPQVKDMLSYAFQILKQSNYDEVASEQFDKIQDLFAAILSKGVAQQLKQGLYREYITKHETLSVMRGKVDMQDTIHNRIQRKQKLACEFDELSENNLFNQILKTTLHYLVRDDGVALDRKIALKKILVFFDGIDLLEPSGIPWSRLYYQRNNRNYELLINICYFVLDGMLQTTDKGEYKMMAFSDEHMARLYEKFILEYYRQHHTYLNEVKAAQVKWDLVGDNSDSIIRFLPIMQTDIFLRMKEKILILDAKYYGRSLQQQYDKYSLHSANVYQIFTYVKNQDKDNTGNVAGILLYAKTDEAITPDCMFNMGGNWIGAKTLDLNADFKAIAAQLDRIAEEFFGMKVA